MHCTQNPQTGREDTLIYRMVDKKDRDKKILIAGAGVAGLEAAIVLARRGYQPTVYEKSNVPGGLINLAKLPPYKADMQKMIDCRISEAQELGIPIHYNTPLTAQFAKQQQADAVIVATGSGPSYVSFEKEPSGRVFSADEAFVLDLPGEKIAVLGGGLVGCELAETLAARGKHVTIFEMTDQIAAGLSLFNKEYLFKRMAEANVDVRLQSVVMQISLPNITVRNGEYTHRIDGFDAAIQALGRKPENALANEIRALSPDTQVFVVGDAQKPQLAMDAVYSAALCAAEL